MLLTALPSMRLYDTQCARLYLNAEERKRFLRIAYQRPLPVKALCLTLFYTGCRLSEACALTCNSLQAGDKILAIRSLKKRNQNHIRELPIPNDLSQSLQCLAKRACGQHSPHYLWTNDAGYRINRITAYRWVKEAMEWAGVYGPQACPKGLRHGFGIHAMRSGVQLNMVQKWMGHRDITTTAIYANAIGAEEIELAMRMWS